MSMPKMLIARKCSQFCFQWYSYIFWFNHTISWSYNLACRTPERLGSDDEEDSLSSPTSRSSRLSRSLRNGEIIPRNSYQNSSNSDDGAIYDGVVAADCYEKRIAFIQKQHEKMLAALHREVEQLKRKNKGFMTWWSCQGCPAFFYCESGCGVVSRTEKCWPVEKFSSQKLHWYPRMMW